MYSFCVEDQRGLA